MENLIRKIARSNKYQFLYSQAKELNDIKIFKNNSDFSKIQILFLQWLRIYDSLYQDLAMKEEYISEEVIKNDLRTDAYLLYRLKKSKEKKTDKKQKQQENIDSDIPTVIFTSKKR